MVAVRTAFALLWVSCAALASYTFDDHRMMLYATSFCHYCVYILTYYTRWPKGDRKKYEEFMLLVFAFKVLALAQLACIGLSILFDAEPYALPPSFSLVFSLPTVVVTAGLAAFGYYVSAAATAALGIEGTYFGIELGFVKAEYEFVKKWPYGFVPHPMIVGQVFAMTVLHIGVFMHAKAPGYPLLLPIHCALYLTHMVQEIYDIWQGPPWFAAQKQN